MLKSLEEKLVTIKNEIDAKLLPENIKAGVTILRSNWDLYW